MSGDLHLLAGWEDRNCKDMPTSVFFPERGADLRVAIAACAGCPIRSECLQAALDRVEMEDVGVWGGTSQRQRRALRKRRRGEIAVCGSESGAKAHRRAGEKLCDACRVAVNAGERRRQAAYRARKRAERAA